MTPIITNPHSPAHMHMCCNARIEEWRIRAQHTYRCTVSMHRYTAIAGCYIIAAGLMRSFPRKIQCFNIKTHSHSCFFEVWKISIGIAEQMSLLLRYPQIIHFLLSFRISKLKIGALAYFFGELIAIW